jgi:hypothetical protein
VDKKVKKRFAWAAGFVLLPLFLTTLSSAQTDSSMSNQPWHKHLADPRFQGGYLLWFHLDESEDSIKNKMGEPAVVVDFGSFQSWQYQINALDKHAYSHSFVFRQSDQRLLSVTRTYEYGEIVDPLFPPKLTEVYRHVDGQGAAYAVRARRLSNQRWLIAFGTDQVGQPVSQLMLIRQQALRQFLPWLDEQIHKASMVSSSGSTGRPAQSQKD